MCLRVCITRHGGRSNAKDRRRNVGFRVLQSRQFAFLSSPFGFPLIAQPERQTSVPKLFPSPSTSFGAPALSFYSPVAEIINWSLKAFVSRKMQGGLRNPPPPPFLCLPWRPCLDRYSPYLVIKCPWNHTAQFELFLFFFPAFVHHHQINGVDGNKTPNRTNVLGLFAPNKKNASRMQRSPKRSNRPVVKKKTTQKAPSCSSNFSCRNPRLIPAGGGLTGARRRRSAEVNADGGVNRTLFNEW